MDPKVATPGAEAAAPARPGGSATARIAKATLLRLAQSRLEPTPENYAKAWIESGGASARGGDAEGQAWAGLVDQLVRGLERRDRAWTSARKQESVQRVLDGSRSHPQRLRERLSQLVASWPHDDADAPVETQPADLGSASLSPSTLAALNAVAESGAAPAAAASDAAWAMLAGELGRTVRAGLPDEEPEALALSQALATQAQRWERDGSDAALLQAVEATCAEVRRSFTQRLHLTSELGRLVRSLSEGLTELAEDDSWARGQADAMRARLDEGSLSVRGVRSAADLLTQTRRQQQRLKAERDRARAALRALVDSLASELEALGGQTGRFGDELTRCTEDLEHADSREQLAAVVHQMLAASRQVQSEVAEASARLASGRAQAETLTERVRELEGELKRLSDEVSTDALTQVANRRGLAQAFEREQSRAAREASPLAVGLLDIDNFKKLNDTLGHAAGDTALKALAGQVRDALRPADHVARFGGEEFVVLLPATALDEAQEVLTRVQRSLSMALLMHEGREVFVTFSAGVTAWRAGEPLDDAIERADTALYEAKRTGKNRTCTA
jgi:diguanylate cyclase